MESDMLPSVSDISPRRAQTRERLLVAANRVFAERGVIGASVEEICEEAGFTRGAFYSNFGGKDELVLALIRHELDAQYAAAARALAVMKQAAAPGPGKRPTTADLVDIALAAFAVAGPQDRDGILAGEELLLYAAREPAIRAAYVAFVEACREQIGALLHDALGHAGLQFSVGFDDAIALLAAAHRQVQADLLLTGEPVDWRPLGVLLLAITRSAGPAGESAGP